MCAQGLLDRRLLHPGITDSRSINSGRRVRVQQNKIGSLLTLVRVGRNRAKLAKLCRAPPTPPNADALPVNVQMVGPADGVPVLIVHGGLQGGIGGGPLTFQRQHALAELGGFRISMLERPGFGQSPSRGREDMVRDSVWIADKFLASPPGTGAGGKVHVLGHSWGGGLSLLAAARHPGVVRSLILVEPAMHMLAVLDALKSLDYAGFSSIVNWLSPQAEARSPGEYGSVFMRSLGRPLQLENGPAVTDELTSKLGEVFLTSKSASPSDMAKAAAVIKMHRIPTLVITGGWSPGFDYVAKVAAKATGGRVASVASPNHFPMYENADEFNRVVEEFWKSCE